MKIAVTGAAGKLGTVVARELRAAGHEVFALDTVVAKLEGYTRVDLTDYGQTVDALCGIDDRHSGLDAVVHLAAIPAGGILTDSQTFHNNMAATFNVFQGARRAGIKTIVYASSETLLGIPFETPPPYVPVDEEYDSRPESMYSLTKHLEEELARKLVRWDPELSISGLRFSNVMIEADYAEFPSFDADPGIRSWNLWGYIDARDGAQAVLRALEARIPGFRGLRDRPGGHGDVALERRTHARRYSPTSRSAASWGSGKPSSRSRRRVGCSATSRSTAGAITCSAHRRRTDRPAPVCLGADSSRTVIEAKDRRSSSCAPRSDSRECPKERSQ